MEKLGAPSMQPLSAANLLQSSEWATVILDFLGPRDCFKVPSVEARFGFKRTVCWHNNLLQCEEVATEYKSCYSCSCNLIKFNLGLTGPGAA